MRYYGRENINLLMTDTDSLVVEIFTEDVYEDMKNFNNFFDFSEYPKNHKCYNPINKKVPGKFKDEAGGKIITEFCGLRSKMYSYLTELTEEKDIKKNKDNDIKESKKAKGVKKNIIENNIKFENYKEP